MDKKTICHIDLSRFYNAPEKQLEILIRKLSEVDGFHQKLFYRKKKDNRFKNNPKISPEMVMMFQMKMNMYENVEHVVKEGKLDVIEFEKLYIRSIFKEEYIEELTLCDLIHSHDRKSTLMALYLYKKYNIPYIITYHKPVPPNDRWYYRYHLAPFVREAYEQASKIITVSNFQQGFLKEWNSNLKSMETIYNTPSFLKEEIDKGESNFFRNPFNHTVILGMVGKHMNIKNYELVVDVALRYIKKSPDIQFVLIGDGEEADAILREKTRHLFNFKMHGYIINIEEHIEYFDAFILPSKNEALGATIVDMMELGKPIIASNVGGIPELIEHGVNGYLFDPDSADDLEKKIDNLIGDPILAERLKQSKLPWLDPIHYGSSTDFMKFVDRGKAKAKELSQEKFIEKHLSLYEKILNNS
jgi:glycosyltransferase involved in cell wall biosynthesis